MVALSEHDTHWPGFVVVGGKPMLVAVPVELPEGTNWAGFFGEGVPASVALRSGLGDVPSLEKLDRFLGFAGDSTRDSTRDSLDEVAPAKEAETLQLGVAVGAAPPPAEKAKADPAMLAEHRLILELLLHGAFDAAALNLREHLQRARQRMLQRLKVLSVLPEQPLPAYLHKIS